MNRLGNRLGNSDSIKIKDPSLKRDVMDVLYNSLELHKYRYNILDNLQKLNYLNDNPHYVSPNFKGYNYFLIFTNINNSKSFFLIDKKKLSYYRNKVNLELTNIYKLKINCSDSLYNGTIFDGKLIKNNNGYTMLITDCYIMMGNKILNMEMTDKMNYINSITNTQFKSNTACKNFVIKVNRLYKYDNIEEIVNNIIPSCKIDVMGLVFYPKYSGSISIFIDKKKDKIEIKNNQENVENKSYHLINNIVEFLSNRNYSYENGKNVKLHISKSEISDVYNLYDDNKKIGIAHIPNIKTSLYLQNNILKDDKYLINCVYYKKFDKYIPLSLV